ncbi:hypothetical protein [Fluviispira sanaruensis]|uniref:Uncharacterized protein n=1 Tax=Fluviispira sanaruensis TaxID=2493639 RepID=A0A4P2VMQ2_FLUSA|nr:hypothetical protein [Fluviispira sanaruensis]BBH54261.1 hypothetical protein JCM31447_27250 [Fluviispira sanaruensis]
MVRFKISFFSVLLCFSSTTLIAKQPISSTYVFCANKNNNIYWRWAVDEKNEYVTIKGYWEKVLENDLASSLRSDHANYKYLFDFNRNTFVFVTSYSEYYRTKKYCNKDEFMQPADSSFSDWYGFELANSH